MPAFTDTLTNTLMSFLFDAGTFTKPNQSNWRLALFTTATTVATAGTEVTGGSYARQAITFSYTNGDRYAESDVQVQFTNMPAATVTHAALYMNTSTYAVQGAFDTPLNVLAGTTLTFAVGDVVVRLS